MDADILKYEKAAVAKRIKVMQAFVDGSQIQWYDPESEQWVDSLYPSFEPNTEYRVSPVVKRTMYLSQGLPIRLFDGEIIKDTNGMTPVEVTFTIPEDYKPQY